MEARSGGSSNPKEDYSLESGGGGHHESTHHQSYHNSLSSVFSKIVLLFGVVLLICLVIYQSDYTDQFFQRTSSFSGENDVSTIKNLSAYCDNKKQENVTLSSNVTTQQDLDGSSTHQFSDAKQPYSGNEEEQGLEQLLKKAAMPNKTVIITSLNEAWIEPDSIFDIFLESFRTGNQTLWLLRHIVVINLDQKAFDYCLDLYLHCYFLRPEGEDFSDEAFFMTPGYLKIVWRKIDFLRNVLELGYNFIFTDADIVWFRNPFPTLDPDANLQVACDYFNGNHFDLNNGPNTGFMYVKSSNQTIEFYKFWYKSRELHPGMHDQDAFNVIKSDPFMKEIGLEIRFLDTVNFGGFCQPSRDLNFVCTMHANCCIGLDNKIHDLKILLDDWKKYLSLPQDLRKSQPPSWTVPQNCGPPSYQNHIPRKKKGNN